MRNAVRRLRLARGLEQQQLARLCATSRQTLSSLEAGRAEPSTALALRLARALGCTVEDLFQLESEELQAVVARSPAPARTSKRAAVAHIDGRWVAHPLPADALGTAAGGLLTRGSRLRALRSAEALRENLLLLGCDPALALLATHLGPHAIWLQAGSTAALDALSRAEAHVAGAHLFDESTGEYNLPFARTLKRDVAVVGFARWREGLAVRGGAIRRFADLGRRGVRIVNREPGAAARRLLERQMREHGLQRLQGVDTVLGSHAAVAAAVAVGAADAGVTTESAALSHGLRFLPLAEERSDLVLPLALLREARGTRLLETLTSGAFRRDLGAVAAYDARHCGELTAEIHA